MYDEDLIELETLYRAAPVGLCLVDRDLRYVRINERLAAINGKPPGEHIGRKIREIIPEIASQIEPIYRWVFESGEPILDVESIGTLPAEPEVEKCWHSSYYPMKSPDGTVERVSTVVEDITAPRQAKQLLEERLQFEALFSDLSTTFINLPDSALGQEIERWLERIIETLNLDRVSLLEFSEDKTRLMIAHIYEHPGAPSFPGFVASNLSPWIIEKIRRGEMLVLSRCPDDLPKEAKPERHYCRQRGLKSHLTLPLTVGGSILGAMTFVSYRRYVTWSEDLIQRLRIAADVFANALVRKRAEEALKTERQRLFTLLDELPAWVSLKTPDYSVRYANRLCRELFGNPQGKRCYELVGREAPCDECRQFPVLETGELQNFEWTWTKSGRSFLIYFFPFADVDGSPLVLSLGVDITERKQAEEKLRVSEASYRGLFNNMSSGVAVYEVSDSGRDFILKDFNQAAERICRVKKEDLIGKSVQKVFPGIKEFGMLEVLHRVWETGNPEHYSVSFYQDQRFNGWIANYVLKLPTGEIVAIFDDVTERKQAEEALRQSEERYRSLVENIDLGITLIGPDYRIIMTNAAIGRLFRKPVSEFVGKECFKEFEKRDKVCSHCPGRPVMATGLPAETETEGVRDDGSRFPVRISAFPIFGPNGQVVGFIEVVEDITQRRRAEEALRASQEALRKSKESYQSLAGQLLTAQEAERSRLARELHDDLSQRLAALAMEAARLEDQPQSSQGAVSTGLKVMKDKLVEMSIDINAISRRLHPSVLDDLGLADAVHSECASFAQRERIVVNYKSESVPREVPPDVALCIYRIVQEGLRNISRHARATEAEILLIGKGDTIHLLIKDNGIGVNPFQVEKGGLGLASMKERVHLMRGDFSIKSQPGQGTVIEALVPLSRSTLDETDANIAGR
jgi:PAS domain S-box-containing protein